MNHRNPITRPPLLALLCGLAWLSGCAYPGGERDSKVETVELPRTNEILTARASKNEPSTRENPMAENLIPVRVFDERGESVGPIATEPVVKTDEEWKALLTPEQYRVVRNEGTEKPFCGNLLDNKKEGVYTCVACALPLFASNSKFKSGTGWPSFFQPIAAENVHEERDETLGMVRVEIECARCKGHLGHVFEDGPRPTGLRYCLNSESLMFTGADELSKLADPIARGAATDLAETVFAGGCFWCVEAVIEELEGVKDAVSGYTGGSADTANYRAVCSGTTGHAEAVKVIYDPTKITYAELLQVHFATHDPTTLNRQGADRGTQYRSAIFFANDEEKEIAEAMIADLNASGAFQDPIVTTLEPLVEFFDAEAKHQNYVCENPAQGYVRGVALPKVDKVRKKFADKLKARSPLQQ